MRRGREGGREKGEGWQAREAGEGGRGGREGKRERERGGRNVDGTTWLPHRSTLSPRGLSALSTSAAGLFSGKKKVQTHIWTL